MPSNTPGFLSLSADAAREGRRRSSASRSRSKSPDVGASSSSQALAGHSLAALTRSVRSQSRSRSPSPAGGVTSGAALGVADDFAIALQVQEVMVDAEMSKQEAQDRADVELCGNRCFWCLEFSAVHLPSKCPKREMPDMSENWTKGMRKIKCACLQPRGDGIYTIDPRWKGESDKGADKATIALMFEVMGEGLRQLPDGFEGERAWKLTLVRRQ
jgi:hypothetical protein